ncbi:MAG: DNA mismatch repair protein MutS [Clostridia bacterium]|nr:DNA mismatch repair protein MutS [Clostridia bacterium]
MEQFTPMMQQYFRIKEQYPDCILFYRLGDFYEMFFEDAVTVSKELELTLTGRSCGKKERAPMCGVPFHSADGYVARLVERGYKVAICEQMQDPNTTKGMVERDVVRIVTAGTMTDENVLEAARNNFLASVCKDAEGMFAAAFVDYSTGELFVTQFNDDIYMNLQNEFARFMPSEVLFAADVSIDRKIFDLANETIGAYVSTGSAEYYDPQIARRVVRKQFGVQSLTELHMPETGPMASAVGSLISYIIYTQKTDISHINQVQIYKIGEFMDVDLSTKRNLELVQNMHSKNKRGSLLWVLDQTKTAMGARNMRKWVEQPLIHSGKIQSRLDSVEELIQNMQVKADVEEALASIRDIERLTGRIVSKSANARDLRALADSLKPLPQLKFGLSRFETPMLHKLYDALDCLEDLCQILDYGIVEQPPVTVREGGMLKPGYSEQLDAYRAATTEGKKWIAELENKEKEKTGIKTLKIKFNRVFGYNIEVSKGQLDNVPDYYVRRQTLANGERFVTPELKEIEEKVLGAQDKSIQLEYDLFCEMRDTVAQAHSRVQKSAQVIGTLDCLVSLANVAMRNNYCKPKVNTGGEISIRDGRHPVVEQVSKELFVPNDTFLDEQENRLAIITGPNMAGKSTYMRQVALIVLMAQIGSYVPAGEAQIGIVDKIFTRVGASDDLTMGQSTFMVEMSEVANILKNATRESLIIYDEIGRGTSTYDGLAIAWSVLEYTVDRKKCGAKTLFATHYHELTGLEDVMDGVKNYCVAVKERGEDIIFLRKIIQGSADHSYGIEVAKLAGVPEQVIRRGKEILAGLEDENKQVEIKHAGRKTVSGADGQVSMDMLPGQEALEKLKKINIDTLTPIEALGMLHELKQML